MTEMWRTIPGFSMYEASNLGAIRSWRSNSGRRKKPFLLAQRVNRHGYYITTMTNDVGNSKTVQVHVAVCSAWNGPRPANKQTLHRNGVPRDNRRFNLRWGTPKENAEDRDAHGTTKRGSRCYQSRLTEQDIRDILGSSKDYKDLARDYRMSDSHMNAIINRRKWRHINA